MRERTWWIIRGVYVFNNEYEPKTMLSDDAKSEMCPGIYPTREEAQDDIDNFYSDEKYWKNVKAVEIELVPVS